MLQLGIESKACVVVVTWITATADGTLKSVRYCYYVLDQLHATTLNKVILSEETCKSEVGFGIAPKTVLGTNFKDSSDLFSFHAFSFMVFHILYDVTN